MKELKKYILNLFSSNEKFEKINIEKLKILEKELRECGTEVIDRVLIILTVTGYKKVSEMPKKENYERIKEILERYDLKMIEKEGRIFLSKSLKEIRKLIESEKEKNPKKRDYRLGKFYGYEKEEIEEYVRGTSALGVYAKYLINIYYKSKGRIEEAAKIIEKDCQTYLWRGGFCVIPSNPTEKYKNKVKKSFELLGIINEELCQTLIETVLDRIFSSFILLEIKISHSSIYKELYSNFKHTIENLKKIKEEVDKIGKENLYIFSLNLIDKLIEEGLLSNNFYITFLETLTLASLGKDYLSQETYSILMKFMEDIKKRVSLYKN